MNESFLALLLIGLFLIFYLCARPFYLRREIQRMTTEIDQEFEREEFPDFIYADEGCVENEDGTSDSSRCPYNTGLTPDTGEQNF